MKFINFLNKHFDAVYEEYDGENKEKKKEKCIWIYEKGEDSEPFLILEPENGNWIARNVYSVLDHEKIYTENEIKDVFIKTGLIKI
ncbi:hypothetical protein ACPUEX_22455 [Enterobacter vonholyi]